MYFFVQTVNEYLRTSHMTADVVVSLGAILVRACSILGEEKVAATSEFLHSIEQEIGLKHFLPPTFLEQQVTIERKSKTETERHR